MTWSPHQCLQRADEAEALARTVAYEKDRSRLREEARSWRQEASRLESHAELWREPEPPSPLWGWFRRR